MRNRCNARRVLTKLKRKKRKRKSTNGLGTKSRSSFDSQLTVCARWNSRKENEFCSVINLQCCNRYYLPISVLRLRAISRDTLKAEIIK